MRRRAIEAGELRLCHLLVRMIPGFGERACDILAIRRNYQQIDVWIDTGLGEEKVCLEKNTQVEAIDLHDSTEYGNFRINVTESNGKGR